MGLNGESALNWKVRRNSDGTVPIDLLKSPSSSDFKCYKSMVEEEEDYKRIEEEEKGGILFFDF